MARKLIAMTLLHWHECACLAKTDEAAHTPGVAATATTAQICTECGYVIAPATGETESDTTESDTTESDTTESDTTESDTTESDSTENDGTESDTVESNTAESDTSESDADPSTGDTSSMLRWIMLAAGAMVVAVFAGVSRKMKLN